MIHKCTFRQKLFITTLVLLSITGCEEKNVDNYKIDKNGIIYSADGISLYSGVVKDTVAGRFITYKVEKGKKNGFYKVFYENGKPAVSGNIFDNKYQGKWTYFYKNGKVESAGRFKNNLLWGKWIWYYQDGTKKEEGKYINGKREGKWVVYNDSGIPENIIYFSEGIPISESSLLYQKKS